MKLDGNSLRRARERLGYSLEAVGEEAGTSKNSVLRAEHEEDIRPGTARKIAEALRVEVADLIKEPELPKAGAPALQRLTPAARRLLVRLLKSKEAPGVYWDTADIIAVRDEFARIGVSNEAFAGWFERATLDDMVVEISPVEDYIREHLEERPPIEEEVRRLSEA